MPLEEIAPKPLHLPRIADLSGLQFETPTRLGPKTQGVQATY